MLQLSRIAIFSEKDENDFFRNLLHECRNYPILRCLTSDMARSLLKYHGGFSIEGTLDCAHEVAGNNKVPSEQV
jgi:hypothetical protein